MEAAQLLLKEMKTRGMMERYPEEVEYRFTELFYAITLFSYMLGVKHKKRSFVKELRDTMLQEFADFQKNKYFQEFTNAEEKEMIALQVKSNIQFYYLYNLKIFVRNVKKKLRK